MAMDLLVGSQTLPSVRLVIFDKDGTLIDVHAYWANMILLRARALCDRLNLNQEAMDGIMDSMGVDVRQMRVKPEGPVGIEKREIVLQAGVDYLSASGHGDHGDLLHAIFAEVDEQSVNHFDQIIRPLPGVHPLMRALQANGCRIAIATTDRTDRATLAMRHLGIMNAVDMIVGADMIREPKPSPEVIHLIAGRLDVPLEQVVMVGDAATDVWAGINAGCLASVGVASGLTSGQKLKEITSLVVPSIADLEVSAAPDVTSCRQRARGPT